ncbi:MAG: UbiX family flavin prenyltransferase [Betaproteobacteria bacterium]|nr:UbiX family flavin prenyltransferase [Betaproteobacteria bacterium]
MSQPHNITLAWTGASGMPYGVRLLEQLLLANVSVYLLVSTAAQIVAKQEMGWTIPTHAEALQTQLTERYAHLPGEVRVFGREAWFAPVASGSNPADAMVICPCTMGTLAAVAQGMSDNLIERAADVCIKEQRKLIVVPRETPYSVLHLENMLKLARMGVVILPPNPGFYHQPKSVEDLVDFVVARILDHLQVPHNLMVRWGE